MSKLLNFLKNYFIPQSIFLILVNFFRNNKKTKSVDTFIANNIKGTSERSLDIGCGLSISNPFNASELFGVDIRDINSKNTYKCDLGVEKMPFEDSFFDSISAFDLIEHIPRVVYVGDQKLNPFIFLMDDICRCLKKDGYFLSHTPAYPSPAAFQDPTHVNVISFNTYEYYFCDPNYAKNYGFKGKFRLIDQAWLGHHLVTLLQKV